MARVKHVVPTGEVALLWAMQVQDSARNGPRNRNNFYFEGKTIYSYGGHFPIATILEKNGKRVALVTERNYSVTTSGHVHTVRGALRACNIEIIACSYWPNACFWQENIDTWKAQILNLLRELRSARKPESRLYAIRDLLGKVNRYCRLFSKPAPNLLRALAGEVSLPVRAEELFTTFATLCKLRLPDKEISIALRAKIREMKRSVPCQK